MAEQKKYGVRIYKDKKPCLEYMFFSLKDIYTKTTQHIDAKDLSNSIGYTLKDDFPEPEHFDHRSTYTAEIVYYPNKKETEEIAKNSEYGKFISNGIVSSNLPILYKQDENLFNEKYLRKRFFSLIKNDSNFRGTLFDLYDSSTVELFDKQGKAKESPSMNLFRNLLDIMQDLHDGVKEDKLNSDIERLYSKIFVGGFSSRVKMYNLMETEFPLNENKSEKDRDINDYNQNKLKQR